MRLLIFLAVFYISYKICKSWLSNVLPTETKANNSKEDEDIMAKDPLCGVYFPRREGIYAKINGEHLLFCSQECKDKFEAQSAE